jgi:4-amino-4-deoxy-L-arabinose transferase-like glycosyltransferase
MSKFDITTSIFYKWRYYIGYSFVALILLSVLTIAAFFIPAGISPAEHASIITSSQLEISQLWHNTPIDAPYYLLQNLTLHFFGVTLLGIKLPSIILGIATAAGIIFLLRRWFSKNVSVLAALIAVVTGQFLFLAQQGSSDILYIFWPTIVLLLATLVAKRARFRTLWKYLFFIAAALSLYTPLSIYVLIALGSAILLHPHLRYLIRRLSRIKLAAGFVASILIVTPLILTILSNPRMGLTLLGVPSSWPNLLENLSQLAHQYFNFLSPGDGTMLLPIFGLGSMLIIAFGLYRLIKTRDTVRGYLVLTSLILLLIVQIFNPVFISITFVPFLLLLATGLEGILSSWYGIFIAGLIPLVVLVGTMVIFGLERYSYSYRYTPEVVQNFSQDILNIPREASPLVVTEGQAPLYNAIKAYEPSLLVTTEYPEDGAYATTAAARNPDSTPYKVITDSASKNAARFYIYK